MSESLGKILVVDDDQEVRIALFESMRGQGYSVEVAENGSMGYELFQRDRPDLIITDLRMPEMDGIELLQRVKKDSPQIPVIVMTGEVSVETALESMKAGALDYLSKPFSMEQMDETVKRGLTESRIKSEADRVTSRRREYRREKKPIIGQNAALLRLLQKAKAVASSKANVLVLGESGTGKEVIARYIHNESDRREGPFIALNCAALPETLLESELFGHERGAFTGAVGAKKGKFELADGGTLLLDEIGEIPLHLQAKLLRVLQEEEVDRLGGKSPVRVDVHVVATTNRILEEAVKEGKFREDLYYRLNVIPLRLPPLRERRDDIPLLVEFLIGKYAVLYNRSTKKLSSEALDRFQSYHWPGNVREMENLIERAILLSSRDTLMPEDFWEDERVHPAGDQGMAGAGEGTVFPPPVPGNSAQEGLLVPGEGKMINLKEVERQMILQALQKTDNNRTHAAVMLGISVRTLRNKLNEYRNKGMIE